MKNKNSLVVRDDKTVLINGTVLSNVLALSVEVTALQASKVTITFLIGEVDVAYSIK